ncbi:MAG: TolC family protein, partial [Alphaproteobacteria bacterium]|nr:TolC family protein [Alphaproteobacteria bacterium]
MPILRVRYASLTLSLAFCATSLPLGAQDFLTEQAAIERALAREGIATRDDADRDAARAGVAGIMRFDNPELSVSRESVNGDTEWQAGVVQPLDLSGRRGALREAARNEAQAIESEITWRRQELIAETRTAYVGCAAAGAELDIWRRFAGDLGEARRVAEARAREGDTAVYDLRRTRVALSSAEAELSMAEGERKAGCAKLAALTGASDPAIPPSAMTSLRSGEGSGDRADLAAQEQRLVAAGQRVSAAR